MVKKQFEITTDKGRKKKVYKYRFTCQFKDTMGITKRYFSKWYDTKEECQKAELLYRTKKEHPAKASFYEVALACLNDREKKNRVTHRTAVDDRHLVEVWFKPFHTVPIDKVTASMCEELLSSHLGEYSTSYVRRARSVLNIIFKYARKHYGLQTNPIDIVDQYQWTDEERTREMKIWTPEQFEQFLAAVPESRPLHRAFFLILFRTGMRKNEALSLTWSDFDGTHLRIRRQWQDGHWKALKTKKSARVIQIDQRCIDALKSLKKAVSDDEYFTEDWFIFGSVLPMSTTLIDRIKAEAIKESGVEPIRLHDFRHSHASYLISKGVNMYTVSRRLGHSSIQMTIDRYTHLMPEAQDEVMDALD